MKPKSLHHSHRNVGQAMMEYMVLIPAAIMIGIAAAYFAAFVNGAFQRTIDGLNLCEIDTGEPESFSGSTIAHLGDHTIELTSRVYNPDDNTTTVVYRVTSADKPSISHWNLQLPRAVYDNLISVSPGEKTEWMTSGDNSIPVGLRWPGLKFDTGYEVGGGKSKMVMSFVAPTTQEIKAALSSDGTVSRDIIMLFTGNYDWTDAYVVVKAGQQSHQDVISVPTMPVQVTGQDC
jgi:hypothetical protein